MARVSIKLKTLLLVVFFFAAVLLPYLQTGQDVDSSVIKNRLTGTLPRPALGIDVTHVLGGLADWQRRDIKTCWMSLFFLVGSSFGNKSGPDIPALDYQRTYKEPVVKLWLIHGVMLR